MEFRTDICRDTKDNKYLENTAPIYEVDIRSKWARIFADKIDLVEDSKNEKLKQIKINLEYKVVI